MVPSTGDKCINHLIVFLVKTWKSISFGFKSGETDMSGIGYDDWQIYFAILEGETKLVSRRRT